MLWFGWALCYSYAFFCLIRWLLAQMCFHRLQKCLTIETFIRSDGMNHRKSHSVSPKGQPLPSHTHLMLCICWCGSRILSTSDSKTKRSICPWNSTFKMDILQPQNEKKAVLRWLHVFSTLKVCKESVHVLHEQILQKGLTDLLLKCCKKKHKVIFSHLTHSGSFWLIQSVRQLKPLVVMV